MKSILVFLLRLFLALPFIMAMIVGIAAAAIVEVMRFQTD